MHAPGNSSDQTMQPKPCFKATRVLAWHQTHNVSVEQSSSCKRCIHTESRCQAENLCSMFFSLIRLAMQTTREHITCVYYTLYKPTCIGILISLNRTRR